MKFTHLLTIVLVLAVGAVLLFSSKESDLEAVTQDEESMSSSEDVMETEVVEESQSQDQEDSVLTEKVFEVDSFSFGYSVKEIRVSEGDTVTINLTNSEGYHDWVVAEFEASTEQINAGDNTSVTFVADKSGTYEYYCSVGSHRAQGMVGVLIVE